MSAALCSLLITALLSLIVIGSTIAFSSLISLSNVAFFTCYFISIACVLSKRLRGEPLPPSRFRIPSWLSITCSCISLPYILWASIMNFFPVAIPVTPQSMNWSVVVYVGMVVLAGLDYILRGRTVFEPPVSKVKDVVQFDGTQER